VKDKDSLIYDLIFSDKTEFSIDIGTYIEDIYKYGEFIAEIKDVLRLSKVSIVSTFVDTDSKTVMWKIKVKK
jgi:hypothetical protein